MKEGRNLDTATGNFLLSAIRQLNTIVKKDCTFVRYGSFLKRLRLLPSVG